ncbi:EAL domain-containing protein [Enterobacteriaceae bacterium 4M9]|nr:EAL domain-containing protein [Enterobacteriaceae bacterium 4M9]
MQESINYILRCISENKEPLPVDIYLQPFFDLNEFRCLGAEILARGIHQHTVVPPLLFIHSVEENTCEMYRLGHHILRQFFEHMEKSSGDAQQNKLYSLNISLKQLVRPHFSDDVISLAQRRKIDPHNLILEITETCQERNCLAAQNLHRLRQYGFSLAWDDICRREELEEKNGFVLSDYIKLDRSLLMDANRNEAKSIIAHAHNQGQRVIAEGIETPKHVDFMRQQQVSIAQGYLFSRPLEKMRFNEQFL